jgi:hypothetical protein
MHFFFGRIMLLENVVNLVCLLLLTVQMLDHVGLLLQAKGLNGGSLIQVDFIELDNLLLTLELILKLHLQLLLELNLLLLVQPQLLDFVDQLFRGNYVVIYILVMVRRVPWLHVMINVGTMYSGLCCLILVLLGSSE